MMLLKKYLVGVVVLLVLFSLASFAGAQQSPTRNGACDNLCGASQLCAGQPIGGACSASGICDAACQCVPKFFCNGADDSELCCELLGGNAWRWGRSGEEAAFGGFTAPGQAGCVGDDRGEFLRYRECESGVCATDSNDAAVCSSPYSCVFEGKCYTRLDKAADESAIVQGKISESRGRTDKLSQLFQRVEELHKKAKAAASAKERKDASKEIGSAMKDISRLGGGIGEQSQGLVSRPGPGGASSTLLCTPPKVLAQG